MSNEHPTPQSELEELAQTIAGIRKHLSDPDSEAMLKPLLAKQATLRAQIEGGGVITQGSIQVARDKSILGSQARENIIAGDNNSVTHIIKNYFAEEGRQRDPKVLQSQMADYLTWMLDRHGTIELRGIKREGQQVVQLDLETVYVPLGAEAYRSGGRKTFELGQVMALGKRVIITGGPGCGKTTVLLHLAWTLTQAIAADAPALAEEKLGLAGDLPLPIFLPLSAYAMHLRDLRQQSQRPEAREKTLASFISRYLIENQSSFELPADFFERLLRDGQSVILLLDGLDEVPDEADRAQVRQAIENLVTGREQMRVVVTCRSAAYKGRSALGKDFREVQVKPLQGEHLEALVRQAYAALYERDSHAQQTKADELLSAINHLEAERSRRFGGNTEPLVSSPLMVRMLLVVHYSERRLPDQRAELYLKATDAMLLPDYAPDEEVADRIGGLVGGSREIHRELAQHLAFAMHQRGQEQGREISEDDLKHILCSDTTYAEHYHDFVRLTRLRGTLLEERLGVYRFIHLAFQEFLTARYLAEIIRSVAEIADFLEGGPLLDSWWREVILLLVGYLSINAPRTAQSFLRRLCGLDEAAAERHQTLSSEVQVAAAELAGSAILEWPTAPAILKTEIAGRLAALFENPKLFTQAPSVGRAAAGNTLARLGDPRPGIGVYPLSSGLALSIAEGGKAGEGGKSSPPRYCLVRSTRRAFHNGK